MSITAYFRRFFRRAKPARKTHQARPRLGLENLEDRLALNSTLTVSVIGSDRVLTYQAGATDQNELQISRSGNTFTFAETGSTGVGIALNGSVYSSVNYDSTLFDRIQVNLEDPNSPDTVENTLTVLSTNKKINVSGGDGKDTVTVGVSVAAGGQGMEEVTAAVVVDGGKQGANDQDQLILKDRAPAVAGTQMVYTVDGAGVTRERQDAFGNPLSHVKVTGKNVERLQLDSTNSNDIFVVNSTLAPTPVVINAGDGDDRFRVGNMDLLAGKLTVSGQGGNNVLTITDVSATSNRNYVINSGSVVQGTSTIALDTLQGVTIIPPNQDNTFVVQSMTSTMPLTLNGGTGSDTITIDDTSASADTSYQLDDGKVVRSFLSIPTGTVYYNGAGAIDKLIVKAGSGDDTFTMTDTDQPALTLNGGAGTDTIDYSAFTSSVLVNMAIGYATKADALGALSNVENADGGSGDDLLVGDDKDNVLVGHAGRDVLIGGKGADQLFGGGGEDLLIASDTAFDKNGGSLETIRSTWAGSGNTQSRINTLRNGVGGVQLNDSTVHVSETVNDDAARDVLSGDAASSGTSDWFWANNGTKANQDSLTDYLSSTDVLN